MNLVQFQFVGIRKKRWGSIIVFACLEAILLSFLVLLFIVPRTTGTLSFDVIKSEEGGLAADKVMEALTRSLSMELLPMVLGDQEEAQEGLAIIDGMLIGNPIDSYRLVNVQSTIFTPVNGESTTTEVFEFETTHRDGYGYVTAVIVTQNGRTSLNGLRFDEMEVPSSELNQFYKPDFGPDRTLLLSFGILLMLFVAFTLWHYFQHSPYPRIGIMILLSLSFGELAINWNTFSVTANLLQVAISPMSVFRPGNTGVWQFELALPLFAVVYWLFWRNRLFEKDRNKMFIRREKAPSTDDSHDLAGVTLDNDNRTT